ncbi:MAG: nucleoside kinase [Candidatus Sumerlaeia bacterium]|nr:nucleoside kinase [Candidatus Sumerlaeia bacterium]
MNAHESLSSIAVKLPREIDTSQTVEIKLPEGKTVSVQAGTQLGKILADGGVQAPATIVAAAWNNKVAPLSRQVRRSGTLSAIDLTMRDGSLIFRRSLTFVLIRAVKELFPDLKIYINHSLNRGYYGEAYDERLRPDEPVELAPSDLAAILQRMKEIVERDEPFERLDLPREEAIELFRARAMDDKVSLLEFRTDEQVSVYRSGPLVNHFYGQLVPSTGCLKPFDLKACAPGFVLLFPKHSEPGELPEYRHDPKMFAVFQEYERWSRILGVRTVAQLNRLVEAQEMREFVLISEALHEKKLAYLADMIVGSHLKPRIILLSGPSASGKTTTVKRLSIQLRVLGLRPLVISLDDFFVSREETPRDANGDYDFEAFEAIDVNKLQQAVRDLLHGDEAEIPHFDFQAGRAVGGRRVRLQKGQPLILEGIHGLNHRLLPTIPDALKFKIYVSPLTHLNVDDHNRISSSDIRLMRRMVRDAQFRGYTALDTMRRWASVRRGEERNIFPYQGQADYIFNSSLHYELTVLRGLAMPLLQAVERSEPEFMEASRLIKFLSYFKEIKKDWVPRHSLLREFVGGSSFKY